MFYETYIACVDLLIHSASDVLGRSNDPECLVSQTKLDNLTPFFVKDDDDIRNYKKNNTWEILLFFKKKKKNRCNNNLKWCCYIEKLMYIGTLGLVYDEFSSFFDDWNELGIYMSIYRHFDLPPINGKLQQFTSDKRLIKR